MILPLIQKRRSIRKYQKKPVEIDKIQTLVEAALRSPSSMGYNPWEFVVVDDADLLDKLSRPNPRARPSLRMPLWASWSAPIPKEAPSGSKMPPLRALIFNSLQSPWALAVAGSRSARECMTRQRQPKPISLRF